MLVCLDTKYGMIGVSGKAKAGEEGSKCVTSWWEAGQARGRGETVRTVVRSKPSISIPRGTQAKLGIVEKRNIRLDTA